MNGRHLAFWASIAWAVAGCSNVGITPTGAVPPAPNLYASLSGRPYLYVGNEASVAVYAWGASKPFRTIKRSTYAQQLTFDSRGDLYVLCGGIDIGSTVEYAAGTSKILRSFNSEGVPSIGIDSDGYLYIAGGEVFVYRPTGEKLWHVMHKGANSPSALLFSPSGKLYIAHVEGVSIFEPDRPGKPKLERRFNDGIKTPHALAWSPKHEIAVGNCATCPGYITRRDTVTVYSAAGSLLRKIVKGIHTPLALAFDSTGRLYVANDPLTKRGYKRGWISVYAPGGTTPLRRITQGIGVALGIAVGPNDDLYVANSSKSTVTVYSPGGAKLLRTIADGVRYPQGLAFSNI